MSVLIFFHLFQMVKINKKLKSRVESSFYSLGFISFYQVFEAYRDWGQPLLTQLSPVTAGLGFKVWEFYSLGFIRFLKLTVTGDSPWSASCPQSRQALKTQAYRDWEQPLVTQLSPVTASLKKKGQGLLFERSYA